MKIGGKIGGGFFSVLLLTMILGLWAVYAMHNGAKVADEIANDRLPRFIYWNEAQTDLLKAAYFARAYFEGGDEDNINKTFEYLKFFGENIQELKQINARVHYENTARALDKAEKDLVTYADLIRKNQNVYASSENLVVEMRKSANELLEQYGLLINAIGASLENHIGVGDSRAAAQCTRCLLTANAIQTRIGALVQDIMYAERNNDLDAYTNLQKISRPLPPMRKKWKGCSCGRKSARFLPKPRGNIRSSPTAPAPWSIRCASFSSPANRDTNSIRPCTKTASKWFN